MKIILIVLAVTVALVLIFVGVLTVTEYRPDDVETLEVRGGSAVIQIHLQIMRLHRKITTGQMKYIRETHLQS